jgi:succinate-acetate transporter protein
VSDNGDHGDETVRCETSREAPPTEFDPTAGQQSKAAVAASPTLLANPAAIGLAGFSLANLLLNFINIGWFPLSDTPMVIPLGFFAGGLAQLIAAVAELRRGNTFGVTGFGSYGVFWLSIAMFFGLEEPKFASTAGFNHALAAFLLCWLIWTVLIWIASFRVSLVLNLLFLDLIGVFAFQAAGLGFDNITLVRVGGWFGIALSAIGFYGALEAVVNETFGRSVIPNKLLLPQHLQ